VQLLPDIAELSASSSSATVCLKLQTEKDVPVQAAGAAEDPRMSSIARTRKKNQAGQVRFLSLSFSLRILSLEAVAVSVDERRQGHHRA